MVRMLPLVAVLAPAIGAPLLIPAHRRSGRAGDLTAAAVTLVSFLAILGTYPAVTAGRILSLKLETGFPVPIFFYEDALGLALGLISAGLWLASSIYSISYMEHEHHKLRFNAFSLFSLCGMMGMVLTGNLFTLYIFFEMVAVLSYFLVVHEETSPALSAGLKYLFMGIVGGITVLAAIVATYVVTGSVDITGHGMPALKASPLFNWIFWSFMFGFAVKAGAFPVHVWLPDAHPVAPSPASALLSGVMIKAGAYGMIRIVYAVYGREAILGTNIVPILLTLALVTMMLGSAVAISQTEIKRLLAYSSIAQIGYIVLGIAMLSSQGLQGSVLHIIFHALMKGTLFMCAGAVIHQTGLRHISDLKGIGKRMPITMTCFTIAALSMIGFPPFAGFVSKWTLALGALEAYRTAVFGFPWAAVVIGALLLSSLLNVVYYGPIVIGSWFGMPARPGEEDEEGHGIDLEVATDGGEKLAASPIETVDGPLSLTAPLVVLAAGIVIFGIFPGIPKMLAEMTAKLFF